jgi:alpha-L-rhamnosidase
MMRALKSVYNSFSRPTFLLLVLFTGSSFLNHKENGNKLSLSIADLKCEYATNPIGLDIKRPNFSWEVESEVRGVMQSAYQILIADSPEKLAEEDGNVWNSGKVSTSRAAGISYKGIGLVSGERYYWKVRIWDSHGVVSDYSKPAFFEMGLLNEEDWKAIWVGYPAGFTGQPLYFRRTFSIKKQVRKARVYISGIGYYELYVNGIRVGDHVLDPGVTDYNKRVLYATYDVTGLLKKDNAIGVIVGPGWYGIPILRTQMEVTFADGSTRTVARPYWKWQVGTGPLLRSSIYDGESYDARKEDPGWDLAKDTIHSMGVHTPWTSAFATSSPGGRMVSQQLSPIKVMKTLSPVSIRQPLKGIYVVDGGRNIAGWASIKVKGKRGAKITLKYGELLNRDGTVNQRNLNLAKATDTYILKGGGNEEIWEPKFTYHGFRYIQIEGYPGKLQSDDIHIKVVHSSVDQVGTFKCSNELLNRIHKMVSRTEANNLFSIPTDCPQRNERLGWLNDMTVRMDEALYNFDLCRFYSKFISDITDTQGSDGSITDTAPFRAGYRPADPVDASYLLLAMRCYEFYGNERIIRNHYQGLKAWVDYLDSRTEDGILDYSWWGDWSPPVAFGKGGGPVSQFTPGALMSTGYLYYCARMISQMAALLEKSKDVRFYTSLASRINVAFNRKFWDEQTGGYGSNNQACNSFALCMGLVNTKRKSRVVDNLLKDVKSHHFHLTTGNQCTKYLLEALTENGHEDAAYKIATQTTYPSWGYMLANGATTLWERWEKMSGAGMDSHDHPMLGSIDSWFYKYLVGIVPTFKGCGFQKFVIHPYVVNNLGSASGEVSSVKGMIKSSWRKKDGFIYLDITIPCNSQAMVFVPAKNIKGITEGNRPVNEVTGVQFLRATGDAAILNVGSGTYHFKSEW